ncbi:hypothetical protein O181_025348 [Austropuccinia psidii MF-1]|uniref:Reverse transcriptase domain-containing protein n=1 Tax=Austropuccinia psidii MF-1 TaxID=1389203 RepID=A0A9Q3GZ11_9BASI|nr:hypothetical protein [Austropuccinia psidii MF-1]
MEITTPVLITWPDGKSCLCGDFRAFKNYTKADRYPIPSIPHALDKLAKAKYIIQMDCMKDFHQNEGKPLYSRWVYMSAPGCHLASKCTIPLPEDDGHHISRRNIGRLDGSIY